LWVTPSSSVSVLPSSPNSEVVVLPTVIRPASSGLSHVAPRLPLCAAGEQYRDERATAPRHEPYCLGAPSARVAASRTAGRARIGRRVSVSVVCRAAHRLGLPGAFCRHRAPSPNPADQDASGGLRRSTACGHWSTSSACKRMLGGMVRPRALAALRLITNSNLVGCSTGRSAGLAPLRILST
jgi:hypothetical protein